ncbi:PREDICTED: protein STRUBBELIG-RECEPTOR FAMILY 5 [Ipomoea nil]|uniref:protein STRUBBELIG-RECEPTOR FAMILY 5 n=1 Tax=Ipomoea nil TaxID=35883 RepID=UPI0009014E11|nr:PREDICTED: protein STRUBBELIG-RECEPTOR FAMILY 5 [Ipomoea nil]
MMIMTSRGRNLIYAVVLIVNSFTLPLVLSKTNSKHVSALNVMYQSLDSSSRGNLDGWTENGGDPCGDSWRGITCSGSDVTEIDLSGMELKGGLGYALDKLDRVTHFDVSKNKLKDNIPYQLPPKLQRLDLSSNKFSGTVPYSISQMPDLTYLHLNNNKLSGSLSDMFQKLTKLAEMDLSKNSLSGSLPQSMESLSSLNKLYLQDNKFTGSINALAGLPLDDLNVENNKFTGWVPDELKDIDSIQTGGNSWSSGPAPPPPPGQKLKKRAKEENEKSGMSGVAIAGIVFGVLLLLLIIIALFSKRRSSTSTHYFEDDKLSPPPRRTSPLQSQEVSIDMYTDTHKGFRDIGPSESSSTVSVKTSKPQYSVGIKEKESPSDHLKPLNDKEHTNWSNIETGGSIQVAYYSLADLQSATSNFATGRFLGEGSIGRVYKAKFPDGRVLAVKKIDSSHFKGNSAADFSETVASISKLRHSNIAEIVGYCSEQGQNMLVHDYFRNGSLHEFLHLSDDFSNPLTWNTRVRIALGTARAVEFLHEVCSPSCIHKNIKSSNILLDTELNPHLGDCGLSNFYEQSGQSLGAGYEPPECANPSSYTMKSDVYSFGVVMLELLTGRKPYDCSKPRPEQFLVRWASPQLHDIDALEKMVDPALRGLYPPKSISRFADIIALCVQAEPEFRPPMSEVVEALVRLVQRANLSQREDPNASCRTDGYDF